MDIKPQRMKQDLMLAKEEAEEREEIEDITEK
jgi:hypothetical protein